MTLEQNTLEWLQWRRSKIGASDAPIIMLKSPWSTPYELWMEKIAGVKKSTNWAMQRGHELEPIAREMYEKHSGIKFTPMVKNHPQYEWMIASLDGVSCDGKHIIEIKCPGPENHALAESGEIPEYYVIQMMHQMMVCGLDACTYVSYRNGDIVVIPVERNEELCASILDAEKEFYESMRILEIPTSYKRKI